MNAVLCPATPMLELRDVCGREALSAYATAKERLIAYWEDECARDLDKLMTHFALDAEVITPDDAVRGHAAVAALYRKSFDAYPELTVEMKAGFAGDGAHCFEYSAVLQDTESNRWLVEGINLMRLERGLISSLRSFEDAPRRLPVEAAPDDERLNERHSGPLCSKIDALAI
jgi:hypothetical protein